MIVGSGEIIDGIERHGPHYVYWCYRFERMISDYGRTRTNQKDQEITYSLHFARRFFTRISSYIWEDDDGLFPHQRALSRVHSSLRVTKEDAKEHRARDSRVFSCPVWHEKCVAIVSNQNMGIELWEGMYKSVESYACKKMVLSKGVEIGSTRKKLMQLGASVKMSIRQCWINVGVIDDLASLEDMSDSITPLRASVWRSQVYRPGDHVVVLLDGSTDATHPQNWKAVIRSIFMHEFMGHMEIFFEAEWYHQKYNCEPREKRITWERDDYSQFTILEPKLLQYTGNNCRPLNRIVHKFFPLQRRGDGRAAEVLAMEIGDTLMRHIPDGLDICPPFPEVGDIMAARRVTTMDPQLCVVREVILPSCEGQTSNIGEHVDLPDEDDGEDDMTEGTPSSVIDMGKVKLTWLTQVGSDHGNPIFKARTSVDDEVGFEALVMLRHDFEPTQILRGMPVQWRVID